MTAPCHVLETYRYALYGSTGTGILRGRTLSCCAKCATFQLQQGHTSSIPGSDMSQPPMSVVG